MRKLPRPFPIVDPEEFKSAIDALIRESKSLEIHPAKLVEPLFNKWWSKPGQKTIGRAAFARWVAMEMMITGLPDGFPGIRTPGTIDYAPEFWEALAVVPIRDNSGIRVEEFREEIERRMALRI